MKRLRVTAYCRVSTDSDDQKNSLENQEKYFKEEIEKNPDWDYIPLYADEGTTGTSTRKRKNFNQMIADAYSGAFDIILTKEVSRFARNTVDTLDYTRKLKDIGIGVNFLLDRINSLNPEDEFRLSIMASVAQEESRKTSERVKFGQKRGMENGKKFGRAGLGYKKDVNGNLIIDAEGARIVKYIFNRYLYDGKSLAIIGKELENQGILTSTNGKIWDATAVSRILKNEKYCGDLKQMKTFTPNYLEQKSKTNNGEVDFIILENNHPAIIDRDTFNKVQAEIKRRGPSDLDNKRYSNRYTFSGKLECGFCNSSFISRPRMSKNKDRIIQRWQCSKYFKYGPKHNDGRGCECSMVRSEILEHIFSLALSDVSINKEMVVNECVKLVLGVIDGDSVQDAHTEALQEIAGIEKQIDRVIGLYVKEIINQKQLEEQKSPLDKQKATLENKLSLLSNNIEMISKREALVSSIRGRIGSIVHNEVFSDEVAKELLDKIVIYGKDRYDVYFRGIDANFHLAV